MRRLIPMTLLLLSTLSRGVDGAPDPARRKEPDRAGLQASATLASLQGSEGFERLGRILDASFHLHQDDASLTGSPGLFSGRIGAVNALFDRESGRGFRDPLEADAAYLGIESAWSLGGRQGAFSPEWGGSLELGAARIRGVEGTDAAGTLRWRHRREVEPYLGAGLWVGCRLDAGGALRLRLGWHHRSFGTAPGVLDAGARDREVRASGIEAGIALLF